MAASAARAALNSRAAEFDFVSSVASNRKSHDGPIAYSGPADTPHTGTKALMLAVLEDGIRCYLGNKKRLQREAEMWMYCSRRLVFSFAVLCETFGLDPNATRRALRTLRKEASGLGNLRHRGRQNVRHNVISLA
jgi:hypothetical protein